MRRSVAIAHLLVLAVLVGGVQHALRLCTIGVAAHAASGPTERVATSQPLCHSEPRDRGRSHAPEAPPVCCGPLAAVVSIPSGDARTTLVAAGGTLVPALVAQLPGEAGLRGSAAPSRLFERLRSHPPAPRLRPHLVFESLLV